MEYSIVIPVYNSTVSIEELVRRIDAVFQKEIKETYEIIFVDDGSLNTDTWKMLQQLSAKNAQVKAVQLMRNFGKQGAMLCGFAEASGAYIVTMDDDLQHAPEDIPLLIEKKEHDIVIGHFSRKEHSFFKRFASNLNNWFEYQLIGKPRNIRNSAFKLINSEVVKSILKIKTSHPSISALLFFVTRDVVMTEVSHHKRGYDKSGFTVGKMYKTFSNLIFNNSSFMLRVIAITGMVIALLSMTAAIYFVIKKLTIGIPVTGWASQMTALLYFGGLILFSVGITGEYLIRIIHGVENKPPYIVRRKAG